MAQEPTHPLLSLPDDEIVEKLRVMDLHQIIEFSLISEKSKNLVKSVKMQGANIRIDIDSKVNVNFTLNSRNKCTLKFWNTDKLDSNVDKKLKAPLDVAINFRNAQREENEKTIRKDNYEMEDWMEHFYNIFNVRGADSIFFYPPSGGYDPVDMKTYFGVPSTLGIHHTGSYVNNQAILRTFHRVESLCIRPSVFEGSKIPPEILVQNFTTLRIENFWSNDPRGVVTLEDLLLINSKKIDIEHARMCPEYVNKFLKMWQHGANPRMEHLRFYYGMEGEEDGEANQKIMLKGIKYTEVPADVTRPFRFAGFKDECVTGGIDIWRKDGVKATIISDFYWGDTVKMFVWFDHCIV